MKGGLTHFTSIFLLLGGLLNLSLSDASAEAINFKNKTITTTILAEPPNMNSILAVDGVSFFILDHVMEGLLKTDKDGSLVGGIAQRWDLGQKGATFWLRKDAYWSNGEKVTAHDFVFAWQQVVNPETASQYAFILNCIENAEAITAGKAKPGKLGVIALDDFTLKVDFARNCPYFLSLTTFVSYLPANQQFYEQQQGRYFADVENMIFNGPFVLTEWVHGASLILKKNDRYWDKDTVNIGGINIPYITSDKGVLFNLFRDGETISSELGGDTLKSALQQHMQMKKFKTGGLSYLLYNYRENRISRNKNFRLAIQHVLDREELVYKVIGNPGISPAFSLFPSWLKGVDKSFQQEYPPKVPKLDIQKAKTYLALAKQELNVKELPPLVLLVTDSDSSIKQAEYVQNQLKLRLGLEIKIDKQIFKQRIAKMMAGDYDIVITNWGPDFNDPLTFGDLFYSNNDNNRGLYANSDYDGWVKQAMNKVDQEQRMQAFAHMQDIIYRDAVILPLYEIGKIYVQTKSLKGVQRKIFGGDPSYRYAYIEE